MPETVPWPSNETDLENYPYSYTRVITGGSFNAALTCARALRDVPL